MTEDPQYRQAVEQLLKRDLLPALTAKLDDSDFDYIPIHNAITQANRIFGHGNWTTRIVKHEPVRNADGDTVGYSCVARVAVPKLAAQYDGFGFHALPIRRGQTGDDADAHNIAAKGAESDAVKRALRYLGDNFGNSLTLAPQCTAFP